MQNLIVFDRMDALGYWIHTIDPETLTESRITEGRFPRWSPDAQRLVFSRQDRASMSILVMNADGTDVRQLTRGHFDINASWHPDGKESLAASAAPLP